MGGDSTYTCADTSVVTIQQDIYNRPNISAYFTIIIFLT
jgi:hypothetical protein